MPGTPEQMFAFHAAPNAFSMLTPPPVFIRVKHNGLKSLTDGEVDFTMWFGLLPAHWIARHEPGPIPTSFADRQIVGPLASWRHEHIFEAVPGGVQLTDHITYAHKPGGFWGVFTRLFFGPLPLAFLFAYRHMRTRRALAAMQK
jgi:ligand-binding SRPBCC domain-containing protein